MARGEKKSERRAFQRIPIAGGAVVFNEVNIGEVIDISLGGLSFRTVDDGAWTGDDYALNLLCGNDGFSLDQLPCRTVADFVISRDMVPVTQIERRVCVEFGSLAPEQQEKLVHFLNRHGLEQA